IDETFSIMKLLGGPEIAARSSIRADAQRSLDDLHLNIAARRFRYKAYRETFAAVGDVECDAGLRRGVSMRHRSRCERFLQSIENSLVGDLPGKPHIIRPDERALGRHENAAPMRRRSRDMRDAASRE